MSSISDGTDAQVLAGGAGRTRSVKQALTRHWVSVYDEPGPGGGYSRTYMTLYNKNVIQCHVLVLSLSDNIF